MKEVRKNLKAKGLYVLSYKISSFRYCKLMSVSHELPIRNYTIPIVSITDLINLFEEHLSKLDWSVLEMTEEHGKTILNMEKNLERDKLGKIIVKK